MMWITLGLSVGLGFAVRHRVVEGRFAYYRPGLLGYTYGLVYSALAIGGYVVVAGMIMEFGVCQRLS